MYEPYGESRRFRIDVEKLRELKDRFVENVKKIKYNKWAMVIIAIGVLVIFGGYTGYVTYTGKMNEMNSQIMILERQIEACQDNVTTCLSVLESAKGRLAECLDEKDECEDDLKKIQSDLDECSKERNTLSNTLAVLESTVGDWETQYEDLEDDYDKLVNDIEDMECIYASRVCGDIGMNYYYLEDDTEVICCLKDSPEFCTVEPTNEETINEISC